MNKSTWFPLFLILGSILLIACDDKSPDTIDGCIPPLYEFAYPFGETTSYIPTPMPFSQEWEPQLKEEEKPQSGIGTVVSIAIRNDDEIWITNTLVRYTPSSGQIKKYKIKDEKGIEFYPNGLLISTDGTLWTIGDRFSEEMQEGLYLSRYVPESDSFEVIIDNNGLFRSVTQLGIYNTIKEDPQGNLWFTFGNALIKYDPISNQADLVLDETKGYIIVNHALEVGSDGNIWTIGKLVNEKIDPPNKYIIQYDPQTGNIHEFHIDSMLSPTGTLSRSLELFMDQTNRLWVNNYGWLETSAEGQALWYKIFQSPVFISDNPLGSFRQYSWPNIVPKLETQNRYLWFTFYGGLVRLDLETQQWCLLTSMPVYTIAEDSQHNLWVGGERQIYKLKQLP